MSEFDDDAPVVLLRPATPADRGRFAGFLSNVAKWIVHSDDAAPPKLLVVCYMGEDGKPHVWSKGHGATWQEAKRLTGWVARAVSLSSYGNRNIQDTLDELYANHLRGLEVYAQRIAEHHEAKPWECENCGERFMTERGAVQHERRCVRGRRGAKHGTAAYIGHPSEYWECRCGAKHDTRTGMAAHVREGNRQTRPVVTEIKGVPDDNVSR